MTDPRTALEGEAVAFEGYLFFWLGHVDALYVQRLRPVLRHEGVTLPEWRVLATLSAAGPRTATELAAITVIERTALVRAIDRLAAAGRVTRTADPNDRRRQVVALTEAGRAAFARAREAAATLYASALRGIDADDLARALRLMRTLAENLGGGGYRHLRAPAPAGGSAAPAAD